MMKPSAALMAGLRGAFRFSGRATRAEFWWTAPMLYVATSLVLLYRGLPQTHPRTDTVLTLAAYAMIVPILAVGTRRLSDAGVWRWLFVFTFVFGQFAMLAHIFLRPGALDLWMLTFNAERTEVPLPVSGYQIHHALQLLRDDILPWAARCLGVLCLILAALPTRRGTVPSGFNAHEVSQ